jgi:hypothetical protein
MKSTNHIPSPYSLSFILPLPTRTPHTLLYLFYSPVFYYQCLSWCSNRHLNLCPLWVCFALNCSTLSITLPYSLPPFFNIIRYTSLYSSPSHFICYDITDALSFSFPFMFPPEFQRLVPLLQTHCTSEFVYEHACFCVYVYLWIYLPHMRENMRPLCFCAWLTSLNMMSSNCIHLLSNHISLFLMDE